MISLSLLGWYVLDVLTLGISNIFWTNSYRIAIFSEFYISVRAGYLTQHPSETALFNNLYLYEYAPQSLLDKAYAGEIKDLKQMDPIENVYTGFKGFLERNFGLVFRLSKKKKPMNSTISHAGISNQPKNRSNAGNTQSGSRRSRKFRKDTGCAICIRLEIIRSQASCCCFSSCRLSAGAGKYRSI